MSTAAGDPLPTAEAVALAKGFAARACAEKSADAAWPDIGVAMRWMELTPVIALGALSAACPTVSPERLARCLGLCPVNFPAKLASLQVRGGWRAELVDVVAQQIMGVL